MARTVGPYELIRKIAVGGAAEIYLARKTGALGFEQFYAVKLLLSHLEDDADHRKMMVDEARLTAQLDHPNIVKVHDLGEHDGVLFIVMEHVKGMNLAELLALTRERGAQFPLEAATFIAREVASALQYAHVQTAPDGKPLDLVHRDISPQNILVGYGGEVKVIDFGVAKASIGGRIETKTGIIKGKLTYMAPEYAMGSQQDHRCDIFATGLCLYEMLVGRAAYDIDDPREMVEAVKQARMPQPSKLRPEVDSELERMLARAVEQKPQNRWDTAGEFQTALTSYLSRRDAQYRKESLANWIRTLSPAPEPTVKSSTAHGVPAIEANPDLSDVVATQTNPMDDFAPQKRGPQKTTFGMPSSGGTDVNKPAVGDSPSKTSFGMPAAGDSPLSLADLSKIQDEAAVEDDGFNPNMETFALPPDDDTGRLEPDADTGRLSADDYEADAQTGRLADDDDDEYDDYDDGDAATMVLPSDGPGPIEIDPELLSELGKTNQRSKKDLEQGARSEMPTATDIDVNTIRGDMVQKVPQRGRPQILTQSGFQQFAEQPDEPPGGMVDAFAMTAAHDAIPGALDLDPMAVTAPTPSEPMPAHAAPQQQQQQPQHPTNPHFVSETATTSKRDEPLQMPQSPAQQPMQQYQAVPPATTSGERYIPGMRPPEHTPDSGIANQVIFALVAVVALVVIVWLFI